VNGSSATGTVGVASHPATTNTAHNTNTTIKIRNPRPLSSRIVAIMIAQIHFEDSNGMEDMKDMEDFDCPISNCPKPIYRYHDEPSNLSPNLKE
jgi:hypothetical protein